MDEDKPFGPLIVCYKCGSDNFWFDRTMCPPCDSMHNVCSDCASVQPCGDESCEYGPRIQRRSSGAKTATEVFGRESRPTIFAGCDYGIGQSPDYGLGYRRGMLIGLAWALGIEAVVAGLVVLAVRLC